MLNNNEMVTWPLHKEDIIILKVYALKTDL